MNLTYSYTSTRCAKLGRTWNKPKYFTLSLSYPNTQALTMAALIREAMAKNLKRIVPQLDRGHSIRTMAGTVPKMKAYAATTEGEEPNKGKAKGGNYVPIYVALGMIGLAVTLGLHTAKQQFMHAPDVRVKKSRREMVSEVDDPERVTRESEDFIKKSFFRKVANVQEFETPIDDPIHGNSQTREPRVESLKTVEGNLVDRNDSGR